MQLAELPVSSYRGGIPGLRATHPAAGRKIDPLSNDVVRYSDHLKARHDAVLRGVGGGRKVYDDVYSFNGFAAEISAADAAKLSSMPGVVSVTKDELRSVDTSTTGAFLGLTGSDGFYEQTGLRGEDVVIGIVDSGVWPESLSFSDRTGAVSVRIPMVVRPVALAAPASVALLNPVADTYTVVVQGWGVIGSTPYELNTWVLGSAASGNMTVTAPAMATIGVTAPISVTFSGLAAGTKYLGSIACSGIGGLPNPTIVRSTPPDHTA